MKKINTGSSDFADLRKENVIYVGKPTPGTSGVEWLVAECEHHCDTLDAVAPSYEFLKGQLA